MIGQIIILGPPVYYGHVYQLSQELCTPKPRKMPICSNAVILWSRFNNLSRSKKVSTYIIGQIDIYANADICSNPKNCKLCPWSNAPTPMEDRARFWKASGRMIRLAGEFQVRFAPFLFRCFLTVLYLTLTLPHTAEISVPRSGAPIPMSFLQYH